MLFRTKPKIVLSDRQEALIGHLGQYARSDRERAVYRTLVERTLAAKRSFKDMHVADAAIRAIKAATRR